MAESAALPTIGEVSSLTRHKGLVMAIIIVALPAVIIARVPTALIDVLLAVNITLSIVILLTTIYVNRPLEFSVFPSLLLVTTLYRLVLNVATTRLILTDAGTKEVYAAGGVIHAFGRFVAGNDPLVGFIIFSILVIVQFVVITKGATRISEVAARFTLDGMPGKQMAIDADLSAGVITEQEATQRRSEVSREADFYGAMDGASKYVRGDAIAAVVITLINIIGGLIIGMVKYGFTLERALNTFTLLTVGDGLVSQIPAFIIAIGAGLIVTRSAATAHLGEELVTQLSSQAKALGIAGAFAAVMAFTGLPVAPMLALAVACGVAAVVVARAQSAKVSAAARQAAREETQTRGAAPATVDLRLDPLEVEVGYGLLQLVDAQRGGDLLERIAALRGEIGRELGFIVPPIRIRDNVQLDANAYQVSIRGNRVAAGTVVSGHYLAMDTGGATGPVEGTATTDPAFGVPAYWIDARQRENAQALGYTVVDASSVVVTHLKQIVRRHADEILSREDTQKLMEKLKETAPTVVAELVPAKLSVGDVQKVLQNLLGEGVSIRNLEVILETLSDCAGRTKDPEILTEHARRSLARSICAKLADDENRVHVITMDPRVDDAIGDAIEHTEHGEVLTLPASSVRRINRAIVKAFERHTRAGHAPVLLASPRIRLQVKRMTAREMPSLVVLSYNEIVADIEVESSGMVVTE